MAVMLPRMPRQQRTGRPRLLTRNLYGFCSHILCILISISILDLIEVNIESQDMNQNLFKHDM